MEINGDWNTKEMFELYVYNHLKMNNMHKTAEEFKRETGLDTVREITSEGDFLKEWWEINYDILHHFLQTREQVPQQDVSSQAEPAKGIKEEDINNPQGPETGTSPNPEELPMYFAESSKIVEHPTTVHRVQTLMRDAECIGLWNLIEGAKSMNHHVHKDIVATLCASQTSSLSCSLLDYGIPFEGTKSMNRHVHKDIVATLYASQTDMGCLSYQWQ